ncbi:MAG: type II toxin-antitoxin system YafQ family toxin [Clostridiales bacterium]|nr:type II toxin-antitoxin system YafQ family toxin [Clostridiales bacterium]
MLKIVVSNQFKKDLRLAKRRGLDTNKLSKVVNILASNKKLEKKYHDHVLTGNLSGFRECHIETDWLLVYRIDRDELILLLFRTGNHSDIF